MLRLDANEFDGTYRCLKNAQVDGRTGLVFVLVACHKIVQLEMRRSVA